MKYKGTSLLGDNQYGKKGIKFKKINEDFFKKLSFLNGQALHAKSLGFIHPSKNEWINFESEFPSDFKILLDFFLPLQMQSILLKIMLTTLLNGLVVMEQFEKSVNYLLIRRGLTHLENLRVILNKFELVY